MDGQRRIMAKFANANEEEIVGMRAPQLVLGGDEQFDGTDANRWLNEMDGQRRIMAKFANANEEEIVGMRAPQLVLGGDEQFDMMARAGFLYDNSMSVNPGVNGEPYWPQTLDYTVPWACYDAQCPTS
ncbi:hypothetical protein TELCIR_19968 [Teladorsagia circumcincta]|uniref:Uncharacterized protein n=1 Tax=Teladorsagia circumcincta TaxID=45464 RepID=A0A2G9TM87_TELCI|nr:hypothetical protein TELCIR_19968 [Teladorsagia circumcincta]